MAKTWSVKNIAGEKKVPMGNYKIMHGNNVIAAADAGKALGVSGDAVSARARGESKICCGYH